MPLKTQLQPRAQYWRRLKVAKAPKIVSIRALERDTRTARGTSTAMPRNRPCKRRAAANAFWRRGHPWAQDVIAQI